MAEEIEKSSGGGSGASPSFSWTTPWSWAAGLVRTTLTGSKRKREHDENDEDDDPDSESHSRSRFRSELVEFRELLSAMEKREEELDRLASEREAKEERRFRKIEALLENALQELSSSSKNKPSSQTDGGSNSEEEERAAAKEEEGNDDDNNDDDDDETNGEKDSNDADADRGLDVEGLLAGTATPPPGLDVPSHAWLVRYVSLRRYQSEHGDCNPRRTDPQYPGLGAWVSSQRCNFNKRKTFRRDSLMFSLLDEIGFDWEQQSTHRAPSPMSMSMSPSSTAMTTAMTPQTLYKTPKRPKSTPNQNDSKPSTLSDSWLANFERLKDYKLKHGNCNPRRSDPEYPGLGVWVSNQRCNYLTRKSLKKGSEAFARLESIGFEWDPLGSPSGSASSKKKKPPAGDRAGNGGEDPASGASAKPAAAAVATSSAPPFSVAAGTRAGRSARASMSEMLAGNSLSWEQRLAQLAVFKEDRCGGDLHQCAGRHDEVSFPGLRSWMCEQRSKQKTGLLKPERYAKLDAMGFDWRPQGPLVQRVQQQQRRTSEVENLVLTASAWQDMV